MYHQLALEAHPLLIKEVDMPLSIKGLYADNCVWINKRLETNAEKRCVLAEEISHKEISWGDILNQSIIWNRKQELLAKQRAFQRLVPLLAIIDAYRSGARGRYEVAEYLDITEEFLQNSIDRYAQKYGLWVRVNDSYAIRFEPLGIVEIFS